MATGTRRATGGAPRRAASRAAAPPRCMWRSPLRRAASRRSRAAGAPPLQRARTVSAHAWQACMRGGGPASCTEGSVASCSACMVGMHAGGGAPASCAEGSVASCSAKLCCSMRSDCSRSSGPPAAIAPRKYCTAMRPRCCASLLTALRCMAAAMSPMLRPTVSSTTPLSRTCTRPLVSIFQGHIPNKYAPHPRQLGGQHHAALAHLHAPGQHGSAIDAGESSKPAGCC